MCSPAKASVLDASLLLELVATPRRAITVLTAAAVVALTVVAGVQTVALLVAAPPVLAVAVVAVLARVMQPVKVLNRLPAPAPTPRRMLVARRVLEMEAAPVREFTVLAVTDRVTADL
ncbi:hypothetical protein N5079_19900 [Planotetraspora sp. A-T 1434]|uniref:hypothetical protein n=1 Tax=Planotetraspora sp. A-T 1434 TaxID=2979219 RepID=UPI0021BE6329|nr:hypothetical protein [Planotetraspora sp. A-T 1434]MCT9932469.1 hypothetical protein [Planotetraspora sp. A-T 1434]